MSCGRGENVREFVVQGLKDKDNGVEGVEKLLETDLSLLAESAGKRISSLEMRILEMLKDRLQSDRKTSMIWEMNINATCGRSDTEKTLLYTAALMHCTGIPLQLLGDAAFPNCTENITCVTLRNSAIRTLSKYSLVEEEKEDGTYKMHSLIQLAVVERMVREGSLSSHLTSLCRLTILPQTCPLLRDSILYFHLCSIADTNLVYTILVYTVTSQDCWNLWLLMS